MSSDMSEFHATFFEESGEAVQAMETGLLELDLSAPDSEVINTIFRGAHSMKGGAGMFGFTALAEFTHTVETLLDEVREGTRQLNESSRDLLLRAVDCCREMLAALEDGETIQEASWKPVKTEFDALLAGEATVSEGNQDSVEQSPVSGTANETDSSASGAKVWHILFRPLPSLLRTGNEPVRIFRELAELGEFSAEVDSHGVPDLDTLDPEVCYLCWNIRLVSVAPKEAIDACFDWVLDECELVIEEVGAEKVGEEPGSEDSAKTLTPPAQEKSPEPVANSAPPPSPAAGASTGAVKKAASSNESSSIRVGIDKVDALINLVGELVITQSMLSRFGEGFDFSLLDDLRNGLAQLERNTRELQESVMQIRMLPIKFSFSRFPRLVRDLCQKLDKKVNLVMLGEQTELDKTVLEKIGDPLVHIVRNSLDHGIESPEARRAAGKDETGTLTLNAYHAGGNIVIEVKDDGAGINRDKILSKAIEQGLISETDELSDDEINNLIFHPGLSTAKEVSDVSGRGVGMDVVRRNIMDLGGTVDIQSKHGTGSTLTIRLPLTLAILDGQLVTVNDNIYIIPLVSIIESIQCDAQLVNNLAEDVELYRVRDEYIPVLRLREAFGLSGNRSDLTEGLLVVVEADGNRIGLFVDDLMGQQQVVIKSLETNFRQVQGLSGATILGDGTVALILDIPGLMRIFQEKTKNTVRTAA